jgi:hypothetical protein
VAQKIQTLLIRALDGSAAEGTIRFGLGGTGYEIDLNAGLAKKLRDALIRYVDAARRTGRRPERRRGPQVGQGAGHRGKDRGRFVTPHLKVRNCSSSSSSSRPSVPA